MTDHKLRRRSDRESLEPTGLRALIVDDEENYLIYISRVAERFGFAITTAVDGLDGLAAARNGGRFDLVIADCEMPRLNGLEFIASLRNEERYGDVYAVMLTAHEDVETKIAALKLGYDDFLSKSAPELEISAKFSAARRLIGRQRRLDAAVRELYGLATRDELTGVYNRRFLFSEAERMLAAGTPINLVFFDLDDFKRINDTHGHLAGDRILRDIGALFSSRTRHEDLIARYGGDEFVMLVLDLGPDQVEALASRIAADVAALEFTLGDETLSVTVTTGFACAGLLTEPSLASLLSAGDRDLYKNKWVHKHPELDPSLYEYDSARDAHVLEFVTEITNTARRKK